jgi:hypothetical protein
MNHIAANPIPYWSRAGKTREVFEEAFRDFQEIGFTAVKADVPDDMSPSAYAEWIAGYGLAPSLSLFSSPFDDTIDIADDVERAKRFAATQVALGLDRTMVLSMALPARIAACCRSCRPCTTLSGPGPRASTRSSRWWPTAARSSCTPRTSGRSPPATRRSATSGATAATTS